MNEIREYISEAIANADMASYEAEQMGINMLSDELFDIVRKLDNIRKQL
jgi:hypothetical protein|tara:strand:- start:864 stop:1010 length:147 start_codon:yes stop_codon:yes gene_type:complete